MSRRPALVIGLAIGLALAAAGDAAAKGAGPHLLAAGPQGIYAATGDGRVHFVDPNVERVVRSVRLGGFPTALAATPTALWVAAGTGHSSGARLMRLDARSLERRGPRVTGVGRPDMIAAADDTVWIASWSGRQLRGVAPDGGRVLRRIRLPRGIAGVAVGGDRLWVTLYGRRPVPRDGRRRGPSALLALDADTGRRVDRPRTFAGRPWQLVADARGAWVRAGYRSVLGFDRGRPMRRLRFAADIGALALGPRAAWVQTQGRPALVRVDRRGLELRRLPTSLSIFPSALVAGSGSLWGADLLTRSVRRIDPGSRRDLARIRLPGRAGPPAP